MLPSPQCECGYGIEDPEHYFFYCLRFQEQRFQMFSTIEDVTDSVLNVKILLYGDENLDLEGNKKIFDAVHAFITSTARFD